MPDSTQNNTPDNAHQAYDIPGGPLCTELSGPTVGELGEFAVIDVITAAAPSSLNGDDAAVLRHASPNSRAVVTTDMLVEGRHFHKHWARPEEIGQKAIVQNFADVEAMGARAIAALLAISTPVDVPVEFFSRLASGIERRISDYAAELVGGDVTSGDHLVISVTAIGSLGGSLPELSLNRARPEQTLAAHGRIGYSAAGLALLERFGRHHVPVEFAELIDAHCSPRLTPGRGVVARATGASAMTDNSDGLITDVGMIARRSGVAIDIDPEAIAPDELLIEAGRAVDCDPWKWVLTGGEDHTLLTATAYDAPSGFRTIGTITKGEGVTVGGSEPQWQGGWVSF